MNEGGDNQIELKSYATPADLAAVWHALSAEEESRVEALLAQASNYLRQIAMNHQTNLDDRIAADTTGILEENVKMVVVNAAQRVVSLPEGMPDDATQWTQSATPYSQSIGLSSGAASSNLFFKTRELELIGLGSISGRPTIGILRGVR